MPWVDTFAFGGRVLSIGAQVVWTDCILSAMFDEGDEVANGMNRPR